MSSNAYDYILDPEPKVLRLKIGEHEYILKEKHCDAEVKFRSEQMKNISMGADGKPKGMSISAESDPHLVARCLYRLYTDPKSGKVLENPVPVAVVLAWPYRIQGFLMDRLKEISRDEDEPLEQLKARHAAMTVLIAEREQGGVVPNSPSGMEDSSPSAANSEDSSTS